MTLILGWFRGRTPPDLRCQKNGIKGEFRLLSGVIAECGPNWRMSDRELQQQEGETAKQKNYRGWVSRSNKRQTLVDADRRISVRSVG
jgi:hypothetical protein